jgi:hypothetical protein
MKCNRCGDEFIGSSANFNLCQRCKEDDLKIDKFKDEGHTRHCACRMVWGDGECECNKTGEPKKIDKLKLQNKKLKLKYKYIRDVIMEINETVEDDCISDARMMLKTLIENMRGKK